MLLRKPLKSFPFWMTIAKFSQLRFVGRSGLSPPASALDLSELTATR